jgi:hypothetical protein
VGRCVRETLLKRDDVRQGKVANPGSVDHRLSPMNNSHCADISGSCPQTLAMGMHGAGDQRTPRYIKDSVIRQAR